MPLIAPRALPGRMAEAPGGPAKPAHPVGGAAPVDLGTLDPHRRVAAPDRLLANQANAASAGVGQHATDLVEDDGHLHPFVESATMLAGGGRSPVTLM